MAKPISKSIAFTVGDGWAMKTGFNTRVNGVKTPRNITDSDFLAQVRRRATSELPLATITILKTADLPALATNEIILVLYDADTRAIARDSVWDLEETINDSSPQTKFAGPVYARPQVSRVA